MIAVHAGRWVMAGLAAGTGELAAKLSSFVMDNRLPGAVAGVVHGDDLVWSAGAGFADTGTRRPMQPGALFRIASVTKTFTGTAVMQLRDAGRLDLDDPAVAYLPELRGAVSPFAPVEAVTIRRMLSHESGLPAAPPGTDWSVPVYQGDAALTLARPGEIVLRVAPNAAHKYSDLAYQLLGAIVTRVSGVPYSRYLRESVLDPLGMSATGFEPLAGTLLARRATGYGWRTLSDERDPAPDTPLVWAEGGLWSCAEDLGRWISFQLRAYQNPAADSPVLAADSLREMHNPRYLAGHDWTQAWGISWCANRRDDVTWIHHSGGLPGFTSTVCFDPENNVGGIVLLNATSGGNDLAFDLASIARRYAARTSPAIKAPAPAPEQYRPLLGIYSRPELGGWILRLEWRDGNLAFTTPETSAWSLTLTPTSDPDMFTGAPGSEFAGDNVIFKRLPDGRIASVLLMDSTFVRLESVAPTTIRFTQPS
jgi:CubicO group peptidase (beta-lactamase class C family)